MFSPSAGRCFYPRQSAWDPHRNAFSHKRNLCFCPKCKLGIKFSGRRKTFDAGYENGNTPAILEALKKHQAPAVFFAVGNFIKDNPDLIKRMITEGHIVGNHTMTHPDMSQISSMESFQKELEGVEELYTSVTGEPMTKFYRPPRGVYSTENLSMAKELGYSTFFWSLAYVDWIQEQQPSKEEAFQKLIPRIHPGAIVLLHNTSSTNAAILDELLTRWEEMGYQFHSIKELTEA